VTPPTRIRFAEGRLLRGRDLEAGLAAEARQRTLHVCAAHSTGGVALGYAVGVGRQRRGAVVGPGFGYDRRGREVVSARTVFVPNPSEDGTYDLVTSCQGTEWIEAGDAHDGLLLARFELVQDELGDPDVGPRRSARGPGGRLAGGTQEMQIDPSMSVDTSAAGFQRTPYYFFTLAELDLRPWPLGPFLELVDPTSTGFDLTLRAGGSWRDSVGGPVTVHWAGVEPPSRCGGFEPDTAAVADPLDLPDEYGTFSPVPSTTEPTPD